MDIPNVVASSGLYGRLHSDPELLNGVLSLRSVAASLAETISRSVPSFTDHTVRHMDALWTISDRILTPQEIANISNGEAFILACGFYLHDIGMAYAATDAGLKHILASPQYVGLLARVPENRRKDSDILAKVLAYAIRAQHASAALELATKPIPGTQIYLIEPYSLRESWAETCGRVAASHHWSIELVESRLGAQGIVPLPMGRSGDLGYVASVLRLTDYAHFGRDRARSIDRAFRGELEQDSTVHWLAQEQVDGPERDGADLVYRAAIPISDVDAWWLHYEMLKGLDDEIRTVRRYLDRRASSAGRLTLQGIRGATSPEEAAVFVPTSGFLPIEINLRTGSIERLVQLLAGESLYGPEPMAAVRELIQNSRDAVMLKAATATTDFEKASLSIPIRVALQTRGSAARLEIRDPGIGMTQKVMTDYLISIASDYWSTQFHTDFPDLKAKDFQPAGRFGIGFLSVFMLGDSVVVESNRAGGSRFKLELRGLGRRGEIRVGASPSGSGTAISIRLKPSVVDSLKPFKDLIMAFAPMLPHEVVVEVDGELTPIKPGWLMTLNAREFRAWTKDADKLLERGRRSRRMRREFSYDVDWSFATTGRYQDVADDEWTTTWPEYREKGVRLLACFTGFTLLSLKGILVQSIGTPGFVGIIDIESGTPDVSRREVLSSDISGILDRARRGVRAQIVENLNALEKGLLIDKYNFLGRCIRHYGREVVLEASLRWISMLKLPGDSELVNCATLREKLVQSRSLFVAFGFGPWTAMKKWAQCNPKFAGDELATVIDDARIGGPSYLSSGEERTGSLAELWPEAGASELLGTVIRIVAEAWQTNIEELMSQQGWNHSSDNIWGAFQRP